MQDITGNMNNNPEDIEQRLWDYIDGNSNEISAVEKLIVDNAAWRSKYQELLEINSLIQSTELEAPSMRFTKNVMEEISKYQITPATKKYINEKIIYGIGAFFITIIVTFVIYGMFQIDWSAASDNKATFGFDLANVDYGQVFNNTFVNIFMMINIVLALMLFDRYLSSRKKHYLSNISGMQ